MLYMVVEIFKNGDPAPVYERFRQSGRLAPDGLTYISSWVDDRMERCFQLMETDDRALLDEWIARWQDIVDFAVYPVITSTEAAALVEKTNTMKAVRVPMELLLKRDKELLGVLHCYDLDMPWFKCRFEAAAGFSEVKQLFDEELEFLNTDEMDQWQIAYERINALSLKLINVQTNEEIIEFVLHVQGTEACFRY
jgi:hypothetical protein